MTNIFHLSKVWYKQWEKKDIFCERKYIHNWYTGRNGTELELHNYDILES